MSLSSHHRVLVLAPHPDDETLGAGGLLQRAVAVGAACRVIFMTDGDNNPWPQRVLERRLRLDADARARWGARRRSEAYAALEVLGVPRRCAVFLGLRDQELTRLLVHGPASARQRLGAEIIGWRPTVVVMPSLRDRHADHNALAVLALEVLDVLAATERPIVLTYVVHPLGVTPAGSAISLELTPDERARKRMAIERHATQLVFHRRSYLRAASAVETLGPPVPPPGTCTGAKIRHALLDGSMLHVRLTGCLALRRLVLSVVGWDSAMRRVVARTELRTGQRASLVRDAWDAVRGLAVIRRERGGGTVVELPLSPTSVVSRFFVKLAVGPTVFDSDGWSEGIVGQRAGAASQAVERLYRVDLDGGVDPLERDRAARA